MAYGVVGGSGFIGYAVARGLQRAGEACLSIQRFGAPEPILDSGRPIRIAAVGDLCHASGAQFQEVFLGINTLIHTAALTTSSAATPEKLLQTNVHLTTTLAQAAANAGVKRFIFLSSAKVLGERSLPGQPLLNIRLDASPDLYAQSKIIAVKALASIADATGLEVFILRPPLVYGPGVKGNFAQIIDAVIERRPLPLGRVRNNRRSMVGLGNLVDAIITCAKTDVCTGGAFTVCDDEALATAVLLKRISKIAGVNPRLIPVPPAILRAGLRCLGKGSQAEKLLGSLEFDDRDFRKALSWRPSESLDKGLTQAVLAHIENQTPR